MRNFKYTCIDTETSGLNPYRHGITQIAAIDSTGRSFSEHVIPFKGCDYSQKAMELTGKSALSLAVSETNEVEVAIKFNEWLSGAPNGWIFVGANPCFDFTFLFQLSSRTNVALNINRRRLDIQNVAFFLWSQGKLKLREHNGMPLLSVDDLAEACNLKRSNNTHDALEDVLLEEQIMKKLFAMK